MTLILQEADFKAKVPVYNSLTWSLLAAAAEDAQEDYLKPILGETEYDNLETAAASVPYTGATLALYDKLKRPLAHMTAYLAVPDLDLNITTHGLVVRKDENTAPASQARVLNFRLSQLQKAMSGFDKLLTWLEANKATYTDWAAGEGYTELKQGFVNTTAQFNEYVEINKSRYLFMRLRPFRTKIERTELKGVLGSALYDEIKAQIVADTLNADNQALMEMIREGVSCRAITQGIVGLNLQVNEQGWLVHGIQESTSMNMKRPTDPDQIDAMVTQWNKDADRAFGALRGHLNENASATKYAVYYASDLYEEPDDDVVTGNLPPNLPTDTTFIF